MKYFSNFKKKMVERSNKRILEYVLKNPDICMEILRIINNKYENKIYNDLIIQDNRVNNIKVEDLSILGSVFIRNNIQTPESGEKKFIEFTKNVIKKD